MMRHMDTTIYHIYAKDRCLYNSLTESQFKKTWKDLNNMVGLMKTDYTIDDLSYEKLPPGMGGYGDRNWGDPEGEDSY